VWQVTPAPVHAFHVPLPPLCTVVVDDECTVVVDDECKATVVVLVVVVLVVVVVDVTDRKPVLVAVDAVALHADVQIDCELQ